VQGIRGKSGVRVMLDLDSATAPAIASKAGNRRTSPAQWRASGGLFATIVKIKISKDILGLDGRRTHPTLVITQSS
jgi:hypothetical protein